MSRELPHFIQLYETMTNFQLDHYSRISARICRKFVLCEEHWYVVHTSRWAFFTTKILPSLESGHSRWIKPIKLKSILWFPIVHPKLKWLVSFCQKRAKARSIFSPFPYSLYIKSHTPAWTSYSTLFHTGSYWELFTWRQLALEHLTQCNSSKQLNFKLLLDSAPQKKTNTKIIQNIQYMLLQFKIKGNNQPKILTVWHHMYFFGE